MEIATLLASIEFLGGETERKWQRNSTIYPKSCYFSLSFQLGHIFINIVIKNRNERGKSENNRLTTEAINNK